MAYLLLSLPGRRQVLRLPTYNKSGLVSKTYRTWFFRSFFDGENPQPCFRLALGKDSCILCPSAGVIVVDVPCLPWHLEIAGKPGKAVIIHERLEEQASL